ncbi:unnamed protein product [Rhodiola kirilowii]
MCFFFILFLCFFCTMMMTSHALHRHLLHQPFIPLNQPPPPFDSAHPPSQPPQHQPKYPFSSSSSSSSSSTPANAYPFFPSDQSSSSPPPPPPPEASLASFPANISSLVFPNSSSNNKRVSTKLIATIASISVSALLLILVLALILHRRKRRNAVVSHKPLRTTSSEQSQSQPPTVTSDGTLKIPPLRSNRGIIGTSTEFLYLGTVANSPLIGQPNHASIYRKPDSPELRPLPPLPKFNYFTSGEQVSSSRNIQAEDDDDEEFFSPRGSSGNKESLNRTESDTRKVLRFVAQTASFPSSNSNSPTISASDHNQTFVLTSPSLSSSPEVGLTRPRILPTRDSDVEAQSPDKFVSLPPPHPPPMPPPSFWETSANTSLPLVESSERSKQTLKLKLKPLHWDMVRASSEKVMAWDQIKSSSFQLNEEMIESLFMVNSTNHRVCRNILPSTNQENHVLDSRKSQNIAILLRALNVTTDEVCEALLEGNTDALGSELLESLLKMRPSKDEERSLSEFNDESPFKLGPAEKFLKQLLEIPYAFERMDAMLYMTSFESEAEYLTRSFQTLEAACDDLKKSKMFLKLLEAVLKAGNRMNVGTNRGDALAFKLDTLLKLVDVKGTDGKTTLLHFVVQEIIRDEDPTFKQGNPLGFQDEVESKKRSLQVVTSLIGELSNVKKAAEIDFSILSSEVKKLSSQIAKVTHALKLAEAIPSDDENNRKFTESVTAFLKKAEEKITRIQVQQSAAYNLVNEVTEYFHGDSSKEEAHQFRIFLVVRDFLSILDRVCKEVGMRNQRTIVGSGSIHSSFPRNGNTLVFPLLNRSQQSTSGDQRLSSQNYGLSYSSSI